MEDIIMNDKIGLSKGNHSSVFSNTESMIRLREKAKLIKDVTEVFSGLSKNKEVYLSLGRYGKKFRNLVVKSIYKDAKVGTKKINSRIPIFIEMPKYESVGNGAWVEKYGKENPTIENINLPRLSDKKL